MPYDTSDRYDRRRTPGSNSTNRRFARLLPGDQYLPKRIASLPRGVYLAVQRSLENVWFGVAAPVQQACEQVYRDDDEQVDESAVYRVFVELLNLCFRVLPEDRMENAFFGEFFAGVHLSMQERLVLGTQRLGDLLVQKHKLEEEISDMRATIRELEIKYKPLKKRKDNMEKNLAAAEQNLQQVVSTGNPADLDKVTRDFIPLQDLVREVKKDIINTYLFDMNVFTLPSRPPIETPLYDALQAQRKKEREL